MPASYHQGLAGLPVWEKGDMAQTFGPLYDVADFVSALRLGIFLAVFGVLVFLFYRTQKAKDIRSLPGPWCKSIQTYVLFSPDSIGPPYFGPLYAIDFTKAWLQFDKWAHQFGPIYQVTMFGTPWVWISDTSISHELLSQRARKYSDRIALHNVKNTKDNGEFLPLLRHGGTFI
jgi:hypothetical protein